MENEKRLIKPETIKLELAFIGCEPKHLAAVERCATVDAVEVVHGRWIIKETCGMNTKKYHCSVCDKVPKSLCKEDYCPNCGAKMDGGNEDG